MMLALMHLISTKDVHPSTPRGEASTLNNTCAIDILAVDICERVCFELMLWVGTPLRHTYSTAEVYMQSCKEGFEPLPRDADGPP